MRFSSSLKLAFVLALIVSAVAFLGAKALKRRNDTIVPVVFEVQPPNPAPNSYVTITIELDGPSATGQIVTIGSTDPLAFINLPSEVVIPAGDSSTTFTAKTSLVYTRWTVLAATANGGTALAVQP